MHERNRLDELKSQLLELDHQILRNVERRARIAQDLLNLRTGPGRFAPTADGPHLAALEQAVSPPFSPHAVRPIFTAIDAACRSFESAPRVIFVGGEGGFGWMAASRHFGQGAELIRAETSASAIEQVHRSRVDFAVVPYESLEEGPIFSTIRAIAATDLKLVGEHEATQTLALMSVTGSPADIEKIYVSPQDRAACVQYLESNHPRTPVLDVRSPALALEFAAEDHGSAAIVPHGAACSKPLRVARENIGDAGEMRMRYGVVSRVPAPRSGTDATALLFGVPDRPGALHDILQHFKERSCNLRRIQSRPIPGERWEYLFYVEVSGHMTDRALVAALEGVKRDAKSLKIIGSFPLEFPDPSPIDLEHAR